MKLSKSLLQAMLLAVTTGAIISCEKAIVGEEKKPSVHDPKAAPEKAVPTYCPACGMG